MGSADRTQTMANPMDHGAVYRCPDARYQISRAVHLGRLARGYAGCCFCPHRNDTGLLSGRQVRRLAERRAQDPARLRFGPEGWQGEYLNDLTPTLARDLAAALGLLLRTREHPPHALSNPPQSSGPSPTAVIAGDEHPLQGEIVAALSEGLRWAGCHVVEIGPASSPCLALAIDTLGAQGGILVGNPDGRPHIVGLKFWTNGSRPASAGGILEQIEQRQRSGMDRPTRAYGSLRRYQAETPYLTGLQPYYHALRPLRFVLATPCASVVRYLKKLIEPVACQIMLRPSVAIAVPEPAGPGQADFAVSLSDDGEVCRVHDERGREVPAERLLLLIARHLLVQQGPATIVVEEGVSPATVSFLKRLGGRVVCSDSRRSAFQQAMQSTGALLGGGSSGRIWHVRQYRWVPDALATLTLLLVLLSRDDRPLSEVLDAEARES